MKYALAAQLVLLSCLAFGADDPAICELSNKSILSRSSAGLAQVSNLGEIEITCRVLARQFSSDPSGALFGLKVATDAYKISADSSKELVPSEAEATGGGGVESDPAMEEVYFHVLIPLDPVEFDREAHRLLARMEQLLPQPITDEARQRALAVLRKVIRQNRVGHFQVKCRVLDGGRVIGIGFVEFEVLFKDRFSDAGIPASPPV